MGHHNLHYAGDPNADRGVWGTPSSKANFCEEDYAVSLYVAEFINTLTNLSYVYLALRHPRHLSPTGCARSFSWGLDVMSTALVILGVNSALFHATMRQTTQFADEISMFILGGGLLYGIFTVNLASLVRRSIVALLVAVEVVVMSVLYVRSGDILFHVYCFHSMLALVGLRTAYLFYGGKKHSKAAMALFRRRFCRAVGVLILGWFLWNVDLEKCLELRRLRKAMGLPWAWVLELHGWWHVLTAVGACEYVKLIRELDAAYAPAGKQH